MDPISMAAVVAGGTIATLAALHFKNPRIPTAAYLTPKHFARKRSLYGRVLSVGDGDGFRMYHTPFPYRMFHPRIPSMKSLKGSTVAIRLAGVDAPESAHFGMPAQPFSGEAKAYLKSLVLNKNVVVIPLSRDQYERVVGMVYVRQWGIRRNVSKLMLLKGLATVYRQAGGEYDGMLNELEQAEAYATKRRMGIWSMKAHERILPSEHKKTHLRGGGTS